VTVLQDGEVIVRREGMLRRITLNRPKALNALTLAMSVEMTAHLRGWTSDPYVGVVLIDGAGDRAFCAGGDIRALYDAAKSGSTLPAQFWSTEYYLDALIGRYPKPLVVVMDGLVMGGGVGLSGYAAFRIVTERSSVAMPEVGIGFFPDVGASFLLARSPGMTGTHLALTGDRMNAADAIYCGFADVQIASARLAELPGALADCRTATDVKCALADMTEPPAASRLQVARSWIDPCYAGQSVEDIMLKLQSSDTTAATAAAAAMSKASPTSLKVTLRNIRDAVSFKRMEESFQQDFRIALAAIAGHDFVEGVRATIVDKDRDPKWRPNELQEVTREIVDRHFQSVGALELKFPN
jgi:enoyl-CoA hydratase